MDISIRGFDDLSKEDLYDILKARASVFVVEQNCPFCDPDGLDFDAYHLCARSDGVLIGYLRFHRSGDGFALGRVLSLRRREGVATMMLAHALSFIRGEFGPCVVDIEAQLYAESLYTRLGFERTGEACPLDGIPHVRMMKTL